MGIRIASINMSRHTEVYVGSRKTRDTEMEEYMDHIRECLYNSNICRMRQVPTPTQILDHLYIGNKLDAENVHFLKTLKITHVLNCASTSELWPDIDCNLSPYKKEDKIQYL